MPAPSSSAPSSEADPDVDPLSLSQQAAAALHDDDDDEAEGEAQQGKATTTTTNDDDDGEDDMPSDIFAAGLRVLNTPDAFAKANITLQYASAYQRGDLPLPSTLPLPRATVAAAVPDVPARPVTGEGPAAAGGSSGSSKGLRPTIHGIAHAESWAIDLMWDLILRFAYEPWPREFYDDFVEIAKQEGEHFLSWAKRLEEGYGMRYGALKGTETLWECATATQHDVLARLAVINLVHEARGLDTSEGTMLRLARAGDAASAATLKHNAGEEEGHVAAGLRWFRWMKEQRGLEGTAPEVFHAYVRKHYRGAIRPPFNAAARERAGMGPEWYEPLITPTKGEGGGKAKDGAAAE